MASKLRSHFDIFRLLKLSCYTSSSRPLAASFSRYTTDRLSLEKRQPLLCSSLHSLPGNKLQGHLSPQPSNCRSESTRVQDTAVSWNLGTVGVEELDDFTPLNDKSLQDDIGQQISSCVEQGEHGRLYAVVNVRSLQYKVSPGDIIVVKHDFPPDVGERIRLEKVLAVGGSDFTLFGQPLLSRSHVHVEATVVEKTLSHNRVWSVYQKRTNFQKTHVYRERHTMLMINSINVFNITDESRRLVDDKNSLLP